jgi:alpha-beta hydrolase superfamily lysophospholipase
MSLNKPGFEDSGQEIQWKTADDVPIFGRVWAAEGAPRAIVCLVHGLGEHCGRYPHLAAALGRAGFALIACDTRGHGRSGGKRGFIPDYQSLMNDIAIFLDQAAQRYPGLPRFLYGHSLGGSLALNYALQAHPDLAGVIVTDPGLRPAFIPPVWKVLLGRAMYSIWPGMTFANGLEREALSRDAAVVDRYNRDPLVHEHLSARLGVDILESGEWAIQHASEFPLPVLLMHGDADRIASPDASREFAKRAGERCMLIIWNGLYHEIHNEPEQGKVFDAIIDWINRRLNTI